MVDFITEDADRLKPFSKNEILFVSLLSFGSYCSKQPGRKEKIT